MTITEVVWHTSDADEVASRMARLGLTVGDGDGGRVLALRNAIVRLHDGGERHTGARGVVGVERLAWIDDTGAPPRRPRPAGRRLAGDVDLAAIGWATVDLERAASAFRARTARRVPSDAALGADALLLADDGAQRIDVVLLEPNTEGWVAAALARHGEGPVALYLRVGTARWRALPATLTDGLAPFRVDPTGPLDGPQLFVRPPHRAGPFMLFARARPTIARCSRASRRVPPQYATRTPSPRS